LLSELVRVFIMVDLASNTGDAPPAPTLPIITGHAGLSDGSVDWITGDWLLARLLNSCLVRVCYSHHNNLTITSYHESSIVSCVTADHKYLASIRFSSNIFCQIFFKIILPLTEEYCVESIQSESLIMFTTDQCEQVTV